MGAGSYLYTYKYSFYLFWILLHYFKIILNFFGRIRIAFSLTIMFPMTEVKTLFEYSVPQELWYFLLSLEGMTLLLAVCELRIFPFKEPWEVLWPALGPFPHCMHWSVLSTVRVCPASSGFLGLRGLSLVSFTQEDF